MRTLLLALLILLEVVFSEVLYVASASSLRFALEDILDEFRREHPAVEVKVSYGSSGSLYLQILKGAPYDVFLSADTVYPRRLVERGLGLANSYFEYAKGRLVLFSIKPWISSLEDVFRARRIAIPNPEYAPYGRAALQFLRRSGAYGRLRERLLFGANVSQTLQFVSNGGADVGFVSLSLALGLEGGNLIPVPSELYDPVVHAMVITVKGGRKRSAWEFLRFMGSGKVKRILIGYGFEVR